MLVVQTNVHNFDTSKTDDAVAVDSEDFIDRVLFCSIAYCTFNLIVQGMQLSLVLATTLLLAMWFDKAKRKCLFMSFQR